MYRSECAKHYFAINDDGQGLKRGDLIRKIAHSETMTEVNGWMQKFSEKQISILTSDRWIKFIDTNHDVIIFSDSFYEANVDELVALYDELQKE